MKISTKVILVVQILIILVAVALILWKTGVLERAGILDWLGLGGNEEVIDEGEDTDETETSEDEAEPHVPKEWEKIVCGNEVVQPNYSRELDYCLEGVQVVFAADFAVTNECLARKALTKYLEETGRNERFVLTELRYLGGWYQEAYRDMDQDGEEERYWKGTFENLVEDEGGTPVYVNGKGELVTFDPCE